MNKPYLPVATLEEVLNYNPNKPETYTRSSLVNAVAEVLFTTKLIEAKDIAQYMQLDDRKLSNALSIELGLTLRDLLTKYRVKQIQDYLELHPDCTADVLANAIGYASASSLGKFMNAQMGLTPNGRTSHRSPDQAVEYSKQYNAIKRAHLSPEEERKALENLRR